MTNAPVLALPDAGWPFIIDTDASNVSIGAVLSPERDNGELAITSFRQGMKKAERNYCIIRRELLA